MGILSEIYDKTRLSNKEATKRRVEDILSDNSNNKTESKDKKRETSGEINK